VSDTRTGASRVVRLDAARSGEAPLQAGRAALARGEWEAAREHFEAALTEGETPEALEGLGMAAWWLEDAATTLDARERAYRLYGNRGDRLGAARMAVWLADDHAWFRGESVVANGWLRRARRLLDGLPTAAEHGWCALREAEIAIVYDGDITRALRLAGEAMAVGRRLGLVDVEMLALALEGRTLVGRGEMAEGMPRLEEAVAAATAGEMRDLYAAGYVCCYAITACEQVRDYERAAQWCARMAEFCRRWRLWLFSICRTHHARVLIWRGEWAEAEAELTAAIDALSATRLAIAADSLVTLGELRRRQGRTAEAEALFAQAAGHPLALLGRAALALDGGAAAAAAALAGRFLRRVATDNRTGRAAGLELLVAAEVARGEPARARAAHAELGAVADAMPTSPLRASASFAEGLVAAATGDAEGARRHLEDAVDLFSRSGAPFEAARARVTLARVLADLGLREVARDEARLAEEALRALGAGGEADRAGALLRSLAAAPIARGGAGRRADLTRREVEVLRLVAQGLTNQEISARLVLSEHTIHRHVANILTKLGVSSRAAAVARAAREGLLA
jgi:LuxR family maltose regulon positive regulatory protein